MNSKIVKSKHNVADTLGMDVILKSGSDTGVVARVVYLGEGDILYKDEACTVPFKNKDELADAFFSGDVLVYDGLSANGFGKMLGCWPEDGSCSAFIDGELRMVIPALPDPVIGTWVFNGNPVFEESGYYIDCECTFKSNGGTFSRISAYEDVGGSIISYLGGPDFSDNSLGTPYNTHFGGWVDDAYKTIEIVSYGNEPDLILFLTANATKID